MKHRRIWLGDTEDHPLGCRNRDTWCLACGCCEHCYHDCDCRTCDCAWNNPAPPVLHELEDEDEPSLFGGAA